MQKYQTTILAIFLALSAFFQYSNTLQHEYIWDDLIVITNNEKVKKGFGGIKEIFTNYNPSSEKLDEQYGYRPITLSSFALDVELFGIDSYYGHLMNIIYFSILCIVLFLCLRMLFYAYSIWLPFLATLLFIVHPIHVEVVANIKSRDEIFALLFGLLALITAIKYIQKDKIHLLILSIFCFIVAILSKEHLTIFSIIIPFVIILFYKTSFNKILNLALPYLLIVVVRLFAFAEITFLQPILFMLIGVFLLFVFYEIMLFFDKFYNNNQQKSIAWENIVTHTTILFKKKRFLITILLAIFFIIGLFFNQAYVSSLSLFFLLLFYLTLSEEHQNKMLPFLGLAFAVLISCFSSKHIVPFIYILALIQAYYQPVFIKNTIIASLFLFLAALVILPISSVALTFAVPPILVLLAHYTKKNILLAIIFPVIGLFILFTQGNILNGALLILLGMLAYTIYQYQFHKAITPSLITLFFAILLMNNLNNFHTKSWKTAKEKIAATINMNNIVPVEKNKQDEWGLYVENMALGNSMFFAENNAQYAATGAFILGKYIKNFFVPYPLVYFYGYNQIPITNFANWKVLLSILLYLGLFIGAFFSLFRQQNKAMFFAIMFYLFNIALFSHVVIALPDTMSDRYLFMPSIGLCVFTVLIIGQLFKYDFKKKLLKTKNSVEKNSMAISDSKKQKKKSKKKQVKKANLISLKTYQNPFFMGAFLLLCIVLSAMTFDRNKAWKNEATLFSTDMPYLENCARANYYYGNMKYRAYPSAANPTEQDKLKNEMLYRFNKSIEITDNSFYAFWHLTRAYMNFAMYDEAYQTLQKAYKIYPDEFKTHHLMGMYYYYTQDYETAIDWFEKGKKMAIKNQENYYYLAWSYYKNGEAETAIEIMLKAIEIQPEYEGFYNVLSDLYTDYGETEKAVIALEKITDIKPDFNPAYQKLIRLLRQLGRNEDADKYYQKGLKNGAF